MAKFFISVYVLMISSFFEMTAQCIIPCNPNVGVFTDNNPSTIAYDNFLSAFHASVVEEDGQFRVWGESMANNGTTPLFSPAIINNTTYPNLVGQVLYATMGSRFGVNGQMIVLTTDGLYAVGRIGAVLPNTIKNNTVMSKVVVSGKQDGLPPGVTVDSVKSIFASFRTLFLLTCGGRVFSLTTSSSARGNGGSGNQNTWAQVMRSPGLPLTNIVAVRGTAFLGYALDAFGQLWTWGEFVRLGNGNANSISINFATQMILPTTTSPIRMIALTNDNQFDGFSFQNSNNPSYYVITQDNRLFGLGDNNFGQLSDLSTTLRTTWIQMRYSNGSLINNAKWISGNAHDPVLPGIALVNSNANVFTAGCNHAYMQGRATFNPNFLTVNYLDYPVAINPTDTILLVNAGGHTTSFVKKNTPRYGYVGHYISGSIGSGNTSTVQGLYLYPTNFIEPPVVSICGTVCDTPTVSYKFYPCSDNKLDVFIKSKRNNVINYTLNGITSNLTVAINDTAKITINAPQLNNQLIINQVSGLNCALSLNINNTIFNRTESFDSASICPGDSILLANVWRKTAQVFKDSIVTSNCIKVTNYKVILNNAYLFDSFREICRNKPINIRGNLYNKDTILNIILKTSNGCDSVFRYTIKVIDTSKKDSFLSVCRGTSVVFNGISRSVTGLYRDTFLNSKGCDSFLNLNLTV
nr:hypothetical protein [Chitinophagales bacterium]